MLRWASPTLGAAAGKVVVHAGQHRLHVALLGDAPLRAALRTGRARQRGATARLLADSVSTWSGADAQQGGARVRCVHAAGRAHAWLSMAAAPGESLQGLNRHPLLPCSSGNGCTLASPTFGVVRSSAYTTLSAAKSSRASREMRRSASWSVVSECRMSNSWKHSPMEGEAAGRGRGGGGGRGTASRCWAAAAGRPWGRHAHGPAAQAAQAGRHARSGWVRAAARAVGARPPHSAA